MGIKRVGQEAHSSAQNFELIVIYKGNSTWDVHAHCVINQNIFVCKYSLCFIHMQP